MAANFSLDFLAVGLALPRFKRGCWEGRICTMEVSVPRGGERNSPATCNFGSSRRVDSGQECKEKGDGE